MRLGILIVVAAFLPLRLGLASIEGDGLGTHAPSVEELLLRFVERAAQDQAKDAEFAAAYSFRKVKTTEVRDGEGDLKKREVETSLHQPGHGEAEAEIGPGDDRPGRKRRAYYMRQDFNLTRDLMARFRLKVVGSESLEGRSAWVLDFEPAGNDLPAHSLKDRFINRCAGRAWLDAEDGTLVKVQLQLLEPINFVGGLVGAVKQFTGKFERALTPEGHWYARSVEWRIAGRKLFLRRIMSFTEECLDVTPAPSAKVQTETSGATSDRLSP